MEKKNYTYLVKRAFKKVEGLNWFEGCGITMGRCDKNPCYNTLVENPCPAYEVFVCRYNKIVGWIVNGRIIKTNPMPSKRYKQRILGIKKSEQTR